MPSSSLLTIFFFFFTLPDLIIRVSSCYIERDKAHRYFSLASCRRLYKLFFRATRTNSEIIVFFLSLLSPFPEVIVLFVNQLYRKLRARLCAPIRRAVAPR